jgi:hypothetical protein
MYIRDTRRTEVGNLVAGLLRCGFDSSIFWLLCLPVTLAVGVDGEGLSRLSIAQQRRALRILADTSPLWLLLAV